MSNFARSPTFCFSSVYFSTRPVRSSGFLASFTFYSLFSFFLGILFLYGDLFSNFVVLHLSVSISFAMCFRYISYVFLCAFFAFSQLVFWSDFSWFDLTFQADILSSSLFTGRNFIAVWFETTNRIVFHLFVFSSIATGWWRLRELKLGFCCFPTVLWACRPRVHGEFDCLISATPNEYPVYDG